MNRSASTGLKGSLVTENSRDRMGDDQPPDE